ncbi:MAG: hypothetical protein KDF59_01845 [Nitrosomonas sp.]|nr:hypothetical protein [Nitrosomonas sp.]
MSAETHLAKFSVTVQQASSFIFSHTDQPEIIFNKAAEFAVTTEMLSEITGFSTELIGDYFSTRGFDTSELDQTSILINADLGDFNSLVSFNEREGLLSNESLRGVVQEALQQSSIDTTAYDAVFGPQFAFQDDDDIYDAEELGVTGLGDVPATNESIESLFYGSLINQFSALDQFEVSQIIPFPVSERGNSEDFQVFVSEALSDVPLAVVWTENELAGLVAREAAILITELVDDSSIVGVLDHSFLGFAVA